SHLLVFAPHGAGDGAVSGATGPLSFIAVEPQSQVNDAFNLARSLGHEPGGPDDPTGTVVLEPGQTLRTLCVFTAVAGCAPPASVPRARPHARLASVQKRKPRREVRGFV
ncbi:MAG: hypothetical protein ACK58T_01760, partial [Phycisphaerae bacterium]